MYPVARALDLASAYHHYIVILIRCSRQGPGLLFLTLLASIVEPLETFPRPVSTLRLMPLTRDMATQHIRAMLASQASKTTMRLGLQSISQLHIIICNLHRLRNRSLNLPHKQAVITPLQHPHRVIGLPT